MSERCALPTHDRRCPRVLGHAGPCGWRGRERCNAWMPKARERCYRTKGHAEHPHKKEHRTEWAMLCDARSRRASWGITDFHSGGEAATIEQ